MLNEIYKLIQVHMTLLDNSVSISERIFHIACAGKTEFLDQELDNRGRLLNTISEIQSAIEKQVYELDGSQVKPADIDILRTWYNELAIISEKILVCDEKTVEVLNEHKSSTTQEIAHLFKSKEMFKGYNHSAKK